MLLCDGCDRGFHIYCLDPPLEAVPEDHAWFCQQCEATKHTSEPAKVGSAPLEKRSAGAGLSRMLADGAVKTTHPIQPHEPLRIVHTEPEPGEHHGASGLLATSEWALRNAVEDAHSFAFGVTLPTPRIDLVDARDLPPIPETFKLPKGYIRAQQQIVTRHGKKSPPKPPARRRAGASVLGSTAEDGPRRPLLRAERLERLEPTQLEDLTAVCLRSVHGLFVSADAGAIVANRGTLSSWEVFVLEGSWPRFSLRTRHGKYVLVDGRNDGAVGAQSAERATVFRLSVVGADHPGGAATDAPSGASASAVRIALHAPNGKLLCATPSGFVSCTADSPTGSAVFELVGPPLFARPQCKAARRLASQLRDEEPIALLCKSNAKKRKRAPRDVGSGADSKRAACDAAHGEEDGSAVAGAGRKELNLNLALLEDDDAPLLVPRQQRANPADGAAAAATGSSSSASAVSPQRSVPSL
jgi:hypothetical protein